MSVKMSKEDQKKTCRRYLENYLKENNLELTALSKKGVESLKIEGVSRAVKREILDELKADRTEPEKMDVYQDFIEELYKHKDRLHELQEEPQGFILRDYKESHELKERLEDIQKLDEQIGVSVKMNKDIHRQLKEYGRVLGGISIREFVHIALKDLLVKLGNIGV